MRNIAIKLGLLSLSALLASPVALADEPVAPADAPTAGDGLVQDDDDEESESDALDDILGGDGGGEETVREEQEAVRSGDIDDRVGVQAEEILETQQVGQKRTIKTLQQKNFLKLGRFEASPMVGFVTNDPFLNRYIVGGSVGYHVTEIFAVEGSIGFAPDLGEGDWKDITKQLVEENHVSPDISKMTFIGNVTFQFSPIYGKVALSGRNIINFDVYGAFGMGATRTTDDLTALQAENDPTALATQVQTHPTTNFGGGARVVFNEWFAIRVDGRSLVYIETISSTTLEMKNNFILSGGASFFFPSM